ncbi:hypothetical protein DEU56DRAFT_837728 [Suillus clintonianus]|uniref:uncharacterized protein n=1 Tax=Suillus clintonianus TaxID=1904413 RepID=UPI001B86F670|nr:uncharacterized protein DEU56DRAFT_837728 [Suillus clintonianus]KAG2118470.1 hypothetical protein DEU56DRAFT_837728 [Suillus clintonianus]
MPSRYQLRSQRSALTASVENISDTRSESSLTSVPANYNTATVERSNDPHVDSPVLRPVRSYSDVVRTRTDTPQPGAENVSVSALSTGDTPSSYKTSVAPSSATWRTVERQHRRSKKVSKLAPESKKPTSKVDLVKEAESHLTQEERQRILERKRAENEARADEHTNTSREEGPSKGKGVDPRNWGDANLDESEVDLEAQREALRTWKNTRDWSKSVPRVEPERVNESETDEIPEPTDPVQAAVRAAEERLARQYKSQIQKLQDELNQKDLALEKKTKSSGKKQPIKRVVVLPAGDPVKDMVRKATRKPSKKPGSRSTPPAMDATAQIAPKSYLGRAFTKLKPKEKGTKNHKKRNAEDSPDGSSSSSSSSSDTGSDSSESSSSSSSDTTETTSSSETTDSSDSDVKKRRKRSAKKRRHKSNKVLKRKNTLKPIPPTEYDGAEDSRAFHRFITEGTAYLEDGNVSRKRRVFTLSRFLKGKAHEFYRVI